MTGSVAEWLELVTLIHVPQRTGGSRFEPWFGPGSYRWILGEFHPGLIPRFLTCWSTDPNSNLSPMEKPLFKGYRISCCLWSNPLTKYVVYTLYIHWNENATSICNKDYCTFGIVMIQWYIYIVSKHEAIYLHACIT